MGKDVAPNSRQGKPNKNKRFLLNRLQDMYGDDFHPIMEMADAAVKMNSQIAELEKTGASPGDMLIAYRAKLEAWGKIAEYTEPKLRAVEIKHEQRKTVKRIDLRGKGNDHEELIIDVDAEVVDDG